MYLDYYKKLLGDIPSFMNKYLDSPSLKRLQKVGYFCGMDYASKDIYDFREWISRYDHSLTVALMTYKLTQDKKATLAALFHDIATPCFSHVIDYMNKDFELQESTEEYTEEILSNDKYLLKCLKEDNISLEEIANFKNYSVVDNDRPKLCADRLDGIILTAIGWTKDITLEDINNIVNTMCLYEVDNELEIGFNDPEVGFRVLELSDKIDEYCHSNEDNYMMTLLGEITRKGINNNLFTYQELFKYNEEELFDILNNSYDLEIHILLSMFYNIKKDEVPEIEINNIKRRIIKPLVLGTRIGE